MKQRVNYKQFWKKAVGLHREFLIRTLIMMFCDNLLKGGWLGVNVKSLTLVIGSVLSRKSKFERYRKIWLKSLFKIYNHIFRKTMFQQQTFRNAILILLLNPSLAGTRQIHPFNHFIFCFQGVSTKHFIFGTEIYGRSVARMLGSFDA